MAIPVNVSTFSAADPPVTAMPGTAIILVNGHNVEVPEHFRVHVAEKMAHLLRYDDKIIRYDVELFHENNRRQSKLCQRVEITGNGPVVRAEARGPDFYAALAAALGKLKTRLRRSHDRRQVHHGHRTPTSVAEATGTLGL
jgi:ribosomal subunit interface protein